MTKEENDQINMIKKIFSKVLTTLNCDRAIAQIAMAELLVYSFAPVCKNVTELQAKLKDFHEQVMVETAHVLGPGDIKFFQDLYETEKKRPGTMKTLSVISGLMADDVVIRFVNPEDLKNIEENTPSTTPPVSTTKH